MTVIAETETPADIHPEDLHHDTGLYWRVALGLFVLTALEVSTYFWPHSWHRVTHTMLIVMMVLKFVAVAAFFMHLKFDHLILRRLFTFGIILAMVVFLGVLSAMTFWVNSGTTEFNNAPHERPIPPPPTRAPTS